MSIPEILREAALYGPLTEYPRWSINSWLGTGFSSDPFVYVTDFCCEAGHGYDFRYGDDTERRMFLLFVAEALS